MDLFFRHERRNQLCRYPRERCICSSGTMYERLSDESTESLYNPENKDACTNEKEEELTFYNNDDTSQKMIVEKNLTTTDLCQLLAIKNGMMKSSAWCIVESWIDLGIERILEDHEYVLDAYRDMKSFSKHIRVKYIFRWDSTKIDFYKNPEEHLPAGMLEIDCFDRTSMSIQNFLSTSSDINVPVIFSAIWIRNEETEMWSKTFMILYNKVLYTSDNLQIVAKVVRASKRKPISNLDLSHLKKYANVPDYFIYTTINARNQLKAPTEWGICLRPSGYDTTDDEEPRSLRCLACDSLLTRSGWIIGMRLAKYGKQIRENYRAFKNKQNESLNTLEYNSYTVPNESIRSRVAMDFTGSVGRIVEDPTEAKAIEIAEGYAWKRRWRPSLRTPLPSSLRQFENGVHLNQPWFHRGLTRDQATALVSQEGQPDGIFLVRESRSNPGAYVLTYKYGMKVYHTQITPILNEKRKNYVYSLDNGVTRFYDLLQLVEFYQLNVGCLPTRLTHFVANNTCQLSSSTTVVTKAQSI